MRILLVNKFYYPRGGDCIYTINLESLLKKHGHETAIFAMDYHRNIETPWKKYFPSEVKFHMGPKIIDSILRPFGTKEVKDKYNAILDEFHPDVVHLNNIHSQLSPIVAELAHQRGIKVVWTLHDYKLLCPRYDCMRNDGASCDDCFANHNFSEKKQKRNVLKNKCMKNSYLASYIAYKEALTWNRERLENNTDAYICPSHFMAARMKEGGFKSEKLHAHTNFINVDKCCVNDFSKENYYCYVGRLSKEKGIKTLIEAANQLPYKLYVIGKGPMYQEITQIAKKHIEFLGQLNWEELKEIEQKAKFSIIASEALENNPLSVIESECLGTPVLGARIGGIPELIEEGVNGMTFESGNIQDLVSKIEVMMHKPFDYEQISKNAKAIYSDEEYYQFLMNLYK